MQIGVIGIDDKVALELREEIVQQLCHFSIPCVVLTTCARVEIYFSSSEFEDIASHLSDPWKELPYYTYFGAACFEHLTAVTSGLKSAFVGECDIVRQVKVAYMQSSSLTPDLHFLFQKSLKIAKDVRSRFSLHLAHVSLEKVVYEQMEGCTSLLFVGYSHTNRQIISFFRRKGKSTLVLCTRHPRSAALFCQRNHIRLKSWDELHHADHYDGIVVATHANRPLFTRKLSRSVVCDLSVPRCIDPHIQSNLLDMEHFTRVVKQKASFAAQKKGEAENYVAQAIQKQRSIFKAKQNRYIVCA